MDRLNSQDWQNLHQATVRLLDPQPGLGHFAGNLGRVLETIIPARRISIFAFHLPDRLERLFESQPEPLEAERSSLLWQHSREIPYLPDFSAGLADGPFRLLDYMTRRQWHASVLYNEWLREAGTEDALSVLFPLTEARTKLSVNLVRDGRRGFSTRDRTLLFHLRPVVRKILDTHLRARRASARLPLPSLSAGGPMELRGLGLSRRQAEVLWWMTQGKSNWEIGRILDIGEATVCEHAKRLYDKLGLGNRHAAARAAQEFLERMSPT